MFFAHHNIHEALPDLKVTIRCLQYSVLVEKHDRSVHAFVSAEYFSFSIAFIQVSIVLVSLIWTSMCCKKHPSIILLLTSISITYRWSDHQSASRKFDVVPFSSTLFYILSGLATLESRQQARSLSFCTSRDERVAAVHSCL